MGRRKLLEDDALLARVREIVAREGIGVSSRRIAKEIGISSSVLFQRFGSKETLLFAALTPPAPEMDAILARCAEAEDACVRLERLAVGLLAYFRELVRVLVPLATHPAFDYAEFRARHPDSPLEKLMADLVAALEAERRKGAIDCPDPGILVLNLVSVAHSLAMFERLGVHGGEFSQGVVKQLVRLIWRGVAPSKRRAAR